MTRFAGVAPRSLRSRLLLIAGSSAAVALAGMIVLAVAAERLQSRLRFATASVVEEQQIADRIISGVMRQLATISAASGGGAVALREEFDVAGRVVRDGVRAYLFRELTIEERLRLEEVNEEHSRMEISAVQAAQFNAPSEAEDRARQQREAGDHALSLLDAMDEFLRLREAELAALAQRQAATVRWIGVIGAGSVIWVGGLVLVLVVRFTRRRITDPLDRLGEAATKIGAGDLAARVDAGGDMEFEALARGFNQMAERLATAHRALEHRNHELEGALDQVREAQAELVQSEKLGAVGRMTAGLAHELNNPLASVLGFSELLAADLRDGSALTPEEIHTRYVRPIVREATRARLLVRSLLQFSRRSDADIGAVALSETLAVVLNLRHYAFEQAGIAIVSESLPEISVVAEQQRLQGVFLNIVNNALQAMQDRGTGTLRISVALTATRVTLRFEDDGPGLAEPDRVFEPFYTTKNPGEGTGLGLALASRFIASFGGTIRATNRPEGGARFDVDLLRAEQHSLPLVALPASAPVRLPPGCTVLVVEDEPELRDLSVRMLGRLGVAVVTAENVEEARAILERDRIDAVVSDVRMPGESGLELYEWVRRERPALSSRFLFVTGDVTAPELAEFAAAHPRGLIHKPFDMQDYLTRVRTLLT